MKLGFNLIKSDKLTKILLVNSCTRMAKEINTELMQRVPNCSVTFAPSLSLSKILIAKTQYDLIIASSIMPDGKTDSLKVFVILQSFYLHKNITILIT